MVACVCWLGGNLLFSMVLSFTKQSYKYYDVPYSFWLLYDAFILLLVDSEARLLEEELPDLLPRLRPYQLRAANWMVQREKGNTMVSSPNQEYVHCAPYCVPIDFIRKNSRMFYNPFK